MSLVLVESASQILRALGAPLEAETPERNFPITFKMMVREALLLEL